MNNIIIYSLIALFFLACETTVDLPTKSECISKVTFHLPPSFTEAQVEKLSEDIHLAFIENNSMSNHLPIGGFTYPSFDSPIMFFQFKKNCEQKTVLVHEFFSGHDFPTYTISNEQTVPSASTISIKGEFWK